MDTGNTLSVDVPQADQSFAHGNVFIEITLNRKPVCFRQARVTGLEIKTTAIAQCVPIQADFVLFLIVGPGKRKVIGDEDVVHLRPHITFEAIPCDDNS